MTAWKATSAIVSVIAVFPVLVKLGVFFHCLVVRLVSLSTHPRIPSIVRLVSVPTLPRTPQ
uniref:Uncharacterized protein n=1 Tax=Anguilla anguilla TaxID=7936 RepID=A0A0E9TYP6_ANGAN